MSDPKPLRRQKHGIRVQQITVTLPGDEVERLRKEAHRKGITLSHHVADLIRQPPQLAERTEVPA